MEQHRAADDTTANDHDLCMGFHEFFSDIRELGA
jgi:hypothetical protein